MGKKCFPGPREVNRHCFFDCTNDIHVLLSPSLLFNFFLASSRHNAVGFKPTGSCVCSTRTVRELGTSFVQPKKKKKKRNMMQSGIIPRKVVWQSYQ